MGVHSIRIYLVFFNFSVKIFEKPSDEQINRQKNVFPMISRGLVKINNLPVFLRLLLSTGWAGWTKCKQSTVISRGKLN